MRRSASIWPHLPKIDKGELEFTGPDKPHVGWELNRKVWKYAADGSEEVAGKDSAIVGHIILDNVPVFRPIKKGERNLRDEVLEKKDLKVIDKRKTRAATKGYGA